MRMQPDGIIGYAFVQGGDDRALADLVAEAESDEGDIAFVGRAVGRYSHLVKVECADLDALDQTFRRIRAASPGAIVDTDIASGPLDDLPPLPWPPPQPGPWSGDDPLVAIAILVDELLEDPATLAERLSAVEGVLGLTALLSGRYFIKVGADDLAGAVRLRREVLNIVGSAATAGVVFRARSLDGGRAG